MDDSYEVIIVGGGIAGSALAGALAEQSKAVLLLEGQREFRDRVRGEFILPWGVREVQRLGIEQTLLDAGGEYASTAILYDEVLTRTESEASALRIPEMAPGVPGTLNVGHPEASRALLRRAAELGATVVMGAEAVQVTAGSAPYVSWSSNGEHRGAACQLVVGADGRSSGVRRALGIEIDQDQPVIFGAGLLVKGDPSFRGRVCFGTVGEQYTSAVPRQNNLTRLYLFVDICRQSEFTGTSRVESFLKWFPTDVFPESETLVASGPAGPCGGSPMNCSWTTSPPTAEGAVLIGDAAGWNDPIIGQGLSVALRDARMVSEVLSEGDWSPAAFDGYVEERAVRMKRLRVASLVTTAMRCTFTDEGRRRRARWMQATENDELVGAQIACSFLGPDRLPADAFNDEALQRTLNL